MCSPNYKKWSTKQLENELEGLNDVNTGEDQELASWVKEALDEITAILKDRAEKGQYVS